MLKSVDYLYNIDVVKQFIVKNVSFNLLEVTFISIVDVWCFGLNLFIFHIWDFIETDNLIVANSKCLFLTFQ